MIEPDNKEILEEIRGLTAKINSIKDAQMKKMVLQHPSYDKDKIRVKVEDYDPEKSNSKAKEDTNSSAKQRDVDQDKQQTKVPANAPNEIFVTTNKPEVKDAYVPQNPEEGADFLKLAKDIDRPLVHHHTEADIKDKSKPAGEGASSKIHFRMDLNQEVAIDEIKLTPVQVKPATTKSILRKGNKQKIKENVNNANNSKVVSKEEILEKKC